MDKTGWFIVVVLVLGIVYDIIDTSLKVWKYNVEHRKESTWEDRL